MDYVQFIYKLPKTESIELSNVNILIQSPTINLQQLNLGFNHLLNETQDKIDSDWLLAEKAEFPNSDFLFTPVYYNKQ